MNDSKDEEVKEDCNTDIEEELLEKQLGIQQIFTHNHWQTLNQHQIYYQAEELNNLRLENPNVLSPESKQKIDKFLSQKELLDVLNGQSSRHNKTPYAFHFMYKKAIQLEQDDGLLEEKNQMQIHYKIKSHAFQKIRQIEECSTIFELIASIEDELYQSCIQVLQAFIEEVVERTGKISTEEQITNLKREVDLKRQQIYETTVYQSIVDRFEYKLKRKSFFTGNSFLELLKQQKDFKGIQDLTNILDEMAKSIFFQEVVENIVQRIEKEVIDELSEAIDTKVANLQHIQDERIYKQNQLINDQMINHFQMALQYEWYSNQENKNRTVHLINLYQCSNLPIGYQKMLCLQQSIQNAFDSLNSDEAKDIYCDQQVSIGGLKNYQQNFANQITQQFTHCNDELLTTIAYLYLAMSGSLRQVDAYNPIIPLKPSIFRQHYLTFLHSLPSLIDSFNDIYAEEYVPLQVLASLENIIFQDQPLIPHIEENKEQQILKRFREFENQLRSLELSSLLKNVVQMDYEQLKDWTKKRFLKFFNNDQQLIKQRMKIFKKAYFELRLNQAELIEEIKLEKVQTRIRPNNRSRHVTLVFQGFKQDNNQTEWEKVAEFIRAQSNSQVCELNWQLFSKNDIVAKGLAKTIFTSLLVPLVPSPFLLLKMKGGRIHRVGFSNFMKAIHQAKVSGKLIGLAIALGLIFPNQTLSLVGYSLGAEVAKTCIKTLNECGAHEIIHETAFFGGATHFDLQEEREEWNKNIFGKTISGKIINYYSDDDAVLYFYRQIQQESIGGFKVFQSMPQNQSSKENYLMDPIVNPQQTAIYYDDLSMNFYSFNNLKCELGHLDYIENLVELIKKSKFGS